MLEKPAYKKLPFLRLKDLPPPYLEYDYFDGYEFFPFEISPTEFSLPNAWWLAEFSTLVYAEPDVVLPRLEKAGLKEARFFEAGSTQCFVAANDRFAIVCFRGSEVSERKGTIDFRALAADFHTDADVRLSDWDGGGKVHRGFKRALDEIWKDLDAHLVSIRRRE